MPIESWSGKLTYKTLFFTKITIQASESFFGGAQGTATAGLTFSLGGEAFKCELACALQLTLEGMICRSKKTEGGETVLRVSDFANRLEQLDTALDNVTVTTLTAEQDALLTSTSVSVTDASTRLQQEVSRIIGQLRSTADRQTLSAARLSETISALTTTVSQMNQLASAVTTLATSRHVEAVHRARTASTRTETVAQRTIASDTINIG